MADTSTLQSTRRIEIRGSAGIESSDSLGSTPATGGVIDNFRTTNRKFKTDEQQIAEARRIIKQQLQKQTGASIPTIEEIMSLSPDKS